MIKVWFFCVLVSILLLYYTEAITAVFFLIAVVLYETWKTIN